MIVVVSPPAEEEKTTNLLDFIYFKSNQIGIYQRTNLMFFQEN